VSRFERHCGVAGDAVEHMGKRCKSFCHAIERYASLTNTSFTSVLSELEMRHGFRVGRRLEGSRLAVAVIELQRARREFLVHRNSVMGQRRLEKRAGDHAPRAWWLAKMEAGVALGRPLAPPGPCVARAQATIAVDPGAPPAELAIGASVRVIVSSRNRTPRSGQIERRVWHFNLQRWTYFLRQGSRRISKRYFADDLEPWSEAP
jgi:hypothetical protein